VRIIVVAMLCGGCNFRIDPVFDAPAGSDGGATADLALPPGVDGGGPGADLAPPVFMTVAILAGSDPGYKDETGARAQFDNPNGLAVDGAGNLYVADTSNDVVRKVDVNAVVTTLAGHPGDASEQDGSGDNARFDEPEAITVDAAGIVWVSDAGAGTIRRIAAGGAVTTFAGDGTSGYLDGTGTAARFNQPRGLVADGAGNLFVADSSNHVIRRIVVATGAVTTLAGGVGLIGRVDATGTAARFNQPRGLAVDGSGNLYVGDMGNSCIRVVAIASGAVTTLAGTGVAGSNDGIGTAAAFDSMRGVALDGLGDLYVADTQNSTVRKIVLATKQVTTIAGMAHVPNQQLGPLPSTLDQPWGIVVMPGSGALVYTDSHTADLIVIR